MERERRIKIVREDCPNSPREWDNLGTMYTWHRRYDLGDEQPTLNGADWLASVAADLVNADDADLIPMEHVHAILAKHAIIMPLYLFDHSGLSISTSSAMFSAYDSEGWDWGQLGVIMVTREKAKAEGFDIDNLDDRAKLQSILEGEVETYDQYLTGDVWGFIAEERMPCQCCRKNGCDDCDCKVWEQIDSCWGFYGSDPKINGMSEHWDDDWQDVRCEVWAGNQMIETL